MDEPSKAGRPTNRSYSGRPAVVNDEVIQKLESAFLSGCSDLEACLIANISKSTLYNYQKENPDFVERKEILKNSLTLRARLNVSDALNDMNHEDLIELSKWYLERKKKDEFSLRSEITGNNGAPIEIAAIDVTKLSDNALEEIMEARKPEQIEKPTAPEPTHLTIVDDTEPK
jgi:hypothetical protein